MARREGEELRQWDISERELILNFAKGSLANTVPFITFLKCSVVAAIIESQ